MENDNFQQYLQNLRKLSPEEKAKIRDRLMGVKDSTPAPTAAPKE